MLQCNKNVQKCCNATWQKINAKYDDEIVAFDQKIQTAIDAVTQAKNLKFIKEGTVVEEDDTNTIDITPDVLKELEK